MTCRWFLILGLCALVWCCSGKNTETAEVERRALIAYSQQNYHKAARLAAKIRHTHQGKMIIALCNVFDKETHTLHRGLKALEELFHDTNVPTKIRLEAGLALARTIRLEQLLDDPHGGQHSRSDRIFRKIIEMAPHSEYARDAMFYHSLNHFSSCDARVCSDGFDNLEKFITTFQGPRKLLAPLHLLAEHEYIRLRKNYPAAVRHLKCGIDIGFSSPNEQRSAMFRLGFFYYKYLNDRTKAEKALRNFIRLYPDSPDTPSAERFLKKIQRGEK